MRISDKHWVSCLLFLFLHLYRGREEKNKLFTFKIIFFFLPFRAYVLSTPGYRKSKKKKNLKAKKGKRSDDYLTIPNTIFRRSLLFIPIIGGSSSFDSRRPLNITSREAPRTIIFVREHANVSTITTVHSRVLHRLQRCTRLSRRPWSLEPENYVQNVLRPFSSILFPSFFSLSSFFPLFLCLHSTIQLPFR